MSATTPEQGTPSPQLLTGAMEMAFFQRAMFLVLGVLCYWGTFPPFEFGVLAWFAPLLWMIGMHGLRPWRRVQFMVVAGYATTVLLVAWLWPLFRTFSIVLWALLAFYFMLWGWMLGLGERLGRWAWCWPAVAWCGVEYLRGEIMPPTFSWIALGYSQLNGYGAVVTPILGVYGAGLLMVLWGAGFLEGIQRWRNSRGNRALVVALSAVPLLALIPLGEWKDAPLGTAILVQESHRGDASLKTIRETAAATKPELVVFPEYYLHADPFHGDSRHIMAELRAISAETRWGLLFGAMDPASPAGIKDAFHNTAYYLRPSGDLSVKAVKNLPIPFINDGLPAKDVTVAPVEFAPSPRGGDGPMRMGIAICYDGAFQRFPRRMATRGADLLVFPCYNSHTWGVVQHTQHQRMYQVRALETGLPVLVAAMSGPTFGAWPNGSATEALPYHEPGFHQVPFGRPRPTVFPLFGWWLAPTCLLAMGALAGWGLLCWLHPGLRDG